MRYDCAATSYNNRGEWINKVLAWRYHAGSVVAPIPARNVMEYKSLRAEGVRRSLAECTRCTPCARCALDQLLTCTHFSVTDAMCSLQTHRASSLIRFVQKCVRGTNLWNVFVIFSSIISSIRVRVIIREIYVVDKVSISCKF